MITISRALYVKQLLVSTTTDNFVSVVTALWADKWTFEKKSTLFFEISSLPIFSLCLPHLHNEIRDIFLSVQDNTQNEIFVFEVG